MRVYSSTLANFYNHVSNDRVHWTYLILSILKSEPTFGIVLYVSAYASRWP